MSEIVLTIEDAARSLPDVVDRVHASGETALLTRSGQAIARIVPVPGQRQAADDLIAFLHRWRSAHPDPDLQFADAIELSRGAVQAPHDPWE
jgi:antitoxin (DNA-binding transcriptional repressor) of toxin-antitoxin stability system